MNIAEYKAMISKKRVQSHKPGLMNKTESRYASEVLVPLVRSGEIHSFMFEGIKLRLAEKTFYTPDFILVKTDPLRLIAHEIKGMWRDDARVKIKVAAEQFPWIKFVAVTAKKGGWHYEVFRAVNA